jgi:2,4-dienoyl-CoA reductase-like NADH-dependent reductase (Old Yellow Enzyme family)
VTFIHVAARQATAPAFGTGPTLAALARRHGRVPVLANGKLGDPAVAASLLQRGEADLVALARPALANMDWPQRVAAGAPLASFEYEILQRLRQQFS